MLLQAMAWIGTLTTLMLLAVTEMTLTVRVARQHALMSILTAARANAVEDARAAVAASLAQPAAVPGAGLPAPVVTSVPLCVNEAASCRTQIEEDFQDLRAAVPAQMTAGDAAQLPQACASAAPGANAAVQCNLETGGDVQENRRYLTVHIQLRDEHGAIIADTSESVLLRTFALPPYAVVIAAAPAASAAVVVPGDTAGSPAARDSDTLLRSYAPCRGLDATNPAFAGGAAWSNWQGNITPPLQPQCFANSGESSRYQNRPAPLITPSSGWSQ